MARYPPMRQQLMDAGLRMLFRRLFHPCCVSKKPRSYVCDRVLIEGLVQGPGGIAYVRCCQNVLEMAKRMLGRQWLTIEYIDSGTGYFPSLQLLDERCFIDDRTA